MLANVIANIRHTFRLWILLVFIGCQAVCTHSYAQLDRDSKVWVDIPSGDVSQVLEDFSLEMGFQILYATALLDGLESQSIRGNYTVIEAVNAILEPHSLECSFDEATGILVVIRKDTNEFEDVSDDSEVALQANPEITQKMINQNNQTKPLLTFGKIVTSFLFAASTVDVVAQDSAEDEDIFILNPFVVTTDEQSGYLASSTLAGTRIKTNVKDVGAAVSIYTEEFLQDIDGNSLEQILSYTTSTEVAGIDGNFSGAFGGEGNTSQRVESAQSNRVRGLANATLTRNYFATDIPFDSYNSSQLSIIRGPNAILAGAGAPGGIIDGTSRIANYNDFSNISLRIGKNGTYRAVLNLNREIVDDRLAIRVDLLDEERKFRQDPANEKDARIYVATQAKIFDNAQDAFIGDMTLRASFETGEIKGTPPNPLPPMDSLQGWFDETAAGRWYLNGHNRERFGGPNAQAPYAPDQAFSFGQRPENFVEGFPMFAQASIIFSDPNSSNALVGLADPALADVQGFVGVANPGGGFLRGTGDRNRNRAGFSRTRILDRNVFDSYNELMTGAFDFRTSDFDAVNIALEQLFWKGKAGVELVYDKQNYELFHDIPIQGNGTETFIDVNRTLSVYDDNGNPILNPNFLRPFIVTRDTFRDVTNDRDRETFRATAFIGHDFRDQLDGALGWLLGKHTLSGLFQDTSNEFINEGFKSSWSRNDVDYDIARSVGNPGTFRAQVGAWFYIGDSLANVNRYEDMRFTRINTVRPEVGQTYQIRVLDPSDRSYRTVTARPEIITSGYSERKETFESVAIAHQGHFLDDHLITLFSYREDTSNRSIGEFTNARDTSTNGDLTREQFNVREDDELTIGSWTRSIVLFFPEKYLFELPFDSDLRLFWNKSENFTPAGARRNIYNEDIGPPSGETKEFGAGLTLLNNKVDLRVTLYETRVNNASVNAGGNPYGYINTMITRLVDAHNTGVDINDPTYRWNTFGFNSFIDAANAFIDGIPDRMRIGPEFQFNPTLTDNGDGSFTWNPDGIPGSSSTSATVSDGLEIELVLNPTQGWRLAFSASKQEAIRANVAALELQYADEFLTNVENRWGADFLTAARNPAIDADQPWIDQYLNENLFNIRAQSALSNTLLPELAEWRASAVTRYEFQDGKFKGFRLGGSVRWTDQAAVGYPNITDPETGRVIADVNNPLFGDEDFRADLNFGYRRTIRLFDRDVDWNISVYISNVIGSQDWIITKMNPDSTIGQVRVPPERNWSITNTITF